jgi:4a-hydroxytetrahydrobiopterin dehydratase
MWEENHQSLKREFVFKDFSEAIAFISQVAVIAKSMNHHPIIVNNYNVVTLELTTFDKGNRVTEKDKKMALEIDRIIEKSHN